MQFCLQESIKAGCVVSSVGSLQTVNMRLSGSNEYLKKTEKFEILSLNGTVSIHGIHLHLSISNQAGNAFGGHLMDENLIYTTCELIIFELDSFLFTRSDDPQTGFKELHIEKLES